MANLIFLTCHNLQILGKTETGVPRNSHDIDKKLGPVNKIDKRNTETSKNLTMRSCWQVVTLLPAFRFMANLQRSEAGFRTNGL